MIKNTLLSALVLIVGIFANATSTTTGKTTEPPPAQPAQCLLSDAESSDPVWPVFEKAIPACKRAILTLQPGTKLEIVRPVVARRHANGITNFKAKVLSGQGIYDLQSTVRPIENVVVWVSMDLCEIKTPRYEDDNGPVKSMNQAQYLTLTSSTDSIANGDALAGYLNNCR